MHREESKFFANFVKAELASGKNDATGHGRVEYSLSQGESRGGSEKAEGGSDHRERVSGPSGHILFVWAGMAICRAGSRAQSR